MAFKTHSAKPSEVSRRWLLIDASEAPLGRTATTIAHYLIGKYKPNYTPHVDGGDHVVVINAKKAVATGNKELGKKYYRHSGFPGGIKELRLEEVRDKYPERIIEQAVQGMLPKNKLAKDMMKRLHVFAGEDHNHNAQSPEKVEVKA